jgi:hypothetical protein
MGIVLNRADDRILQQPGGNMSRTTTIRKLLFSVPLLKRVLAEPGRTAF